MSQQARPERRDSPLLLLLMAASPTLLLLGAITVSAWLLRSLPSVTPAQEELKREAYETAIQFVREQLPPSAVPVFPPFDEQAVRDHRAGRYVVVSRFEAQSDSGEVLPMSFRAVLRWEGNGWRAEDVRLRRSRRGRL